MRLPFSLLANLGLSIIRSNWPLLELTAELADHHGLTFYDAAHLAAAKLHGVALVTADSALLATGDNTVSISGFAAELSSIP